MIGGMTIDRRSLLTAIAGGAFLLAGRATAQALTVLPVRDRRIARLIGEAGHLPAVAQRIDYISRALLGSPYRGHTLIGGPRAPERFVVRDDVFDCVTYCETVLAASLARTPDQYSAQLRHIRYRGGEVGWRERNHYFSDWCAQNIANNICRPLLLPGSETIDKKLDWMPALGARRVSIAACPRASLIKNKALLSTGDIIGFLSRRPGLDYFHVGFVIVDDKGGLWLRHAARSRRRVIEQPLARFLRDNNTHAVTLLRVREPEDEPILI